MVIFSRERDPLLMSPRAREQKVVSSQDLVGSSRAKDLKKLSVKIDGWSAMRCGGLLNVRKLLRKKEDHLWQRRGKQMQRYYEVGFIGVDGMLSWVKWDELGTQCGLELSADFMRLLGKGSGYRFVNTTSQPKSNSYNGFYSYNHGRSPYYLDDALGMMLTSTQEYFRSSNCCNFQSLRWYLSKLRQLNWIVRKEDRGPRLVLCSRTWESNAFSEFSQQYQISSQTIEKENPKYFLSNAQNRVARIYFIPKTQKPITVQMKGRPIVSFIGCINRKYVRSIVKIINQWVVDQKGFDQIRTDVAVTLHRGQMDFLIGDLESMFTNVPRQKMLEWLKDSNFKTYRCKISPDEVLTGEVLCNEVSRIVTGLGFQYEGDHRVMSEGLPMGHPMSPPIARAVVTWMERNLVQQCAEREIFVTRYVDDVKGSITQRAMDATGVDKITWFKKAYEEAIAPMKIEWRDGDRRYMDSLTDEYGEIEFVQNKPTGILADELPSSICAAVLSAEVRRRVARGDPWESAGWVILKPDGTKFWDSGAGTESHTGKYLEFHRVNSDSIRQRLHVTRPTLPKRTGELLHVPYTGFIRTRRGKQLEKYLKEKYCTDVIEDIPDGSYGPGRLLHAPFAGIFWDLQSKKSFNTICTKSKHYIYREST